MSARINDEYTHTEGPVSITIICTAEFEPEQGPTYSCAGVPASPSEWDVVSVQCFEVSLQSIPTTREFQEFLERAIEAAEEYFMEDSYDDEEIIYDDPC